MRRSSGRTLLLYPLWLYGTDGTDQVASLVNAKTTLACLGCDRALVETACWATCCKRCISDAVSGWLKWSTSETWCSGRARTGASVRTKTCTVTWRRSRCCPAGRGRRRSVRPLAVPRWSVGFFVYPTYVAVSVADLWFERATLVFDLRKRLHHGARGRVVRAFCSTVPGCASGSSNPAKMLMFCDEMLPKLTAATGRCSALVPRRRRGSVSSKAGDDDRPGRAGACARGWGTSLSEQRPGVRRWSRPDRRP